MSLSALTFLSQEKASLLTSLESPTYVCKIFSAPNTYFFYDADLMSTEECTALFMELWNDYPKEVLSATAPSQSVYGLDAAVHAWAFLYNERAYHIRFVLQPATGNQVKQVLLYQQTDTLHTDSELDLERNTVINHLRPNLDAIFFQKHSKFDFPNG